MRARSTMPEQTRSMLRLRLQDADEHFRRCFMSFFGVLLGYGLQDWVHSHDGFEASERSLWSAVQVSFGAICQLEALLPFSVLSPAVLQ
jgi:hypothetical protein